MRPLDPLPEIARLLGEAKAEDVRAALDRVAPADPAIAAAVAYARGALSLRESQLDRAAEAFEEARSAFTAAGGTEEAALCACEIELCRIRRGGPRAFAEAESALAAIAAQAGPIARVTALHYRGAALRAAGRAEDCQRALLEAFAASEGLLPERAQILNSLGTLYVVIGAYGAARALLDHAADLHRRLGDAVGEAIAMGQLGSAALSLGELDAARRYLQKQEWLACRVGDRFGQARALVLLADLAADQGRPDDAVALAGQARQIASAEPPLAMWIAYATRSLGRAKLELGDPTAAGELDAARERFAAIGNQLGGALVAWDEARAGGDAERWVEAIGPLASLGLGQRVAQLLFDRRRVLAHAVDGDSAASDPAALNAVDEALAAAAQAFPQLGAAHEVLLVYDRPAALADLGARRIEGQRNLGRLAALALGPPGLLCAAIASSAMSARAALPPKPAAAALLGRTASLALWAWPARTAPEQLARDLGALRLSLTDLRAAIGHYPQARLGRIPLAGEAGAEIAGADLAPLCARALGLESGRISREAGVPWTAAADELLPSCEATP